MNILHEVENNTAPINKGHKIQLLDELSNNFPVTSSDIFKKAEKICLLKPEFNSMNESVLVAMFTTLLWNTENIFTLKRV